MKIIYLHQYFKFPNESGGTRSFDLASGFIKSGHQVEMITSRSEMKYNTGKRWVKIEQMGLVVHYIYLPYGNHLSYFQRSLVFLKFLWFSTFKLLSLKGDVILATSTPLTIGIPALVKKWVHNTPFVFEARDVWPEAVIAIGAIKNKLMQKALYFLEKIIYSNAVAIVPLSVDMKHSIVSRYPKLTNKPIVVIENISEIHRFQNEYDNQHDIINKLFGVTPRFLVLYAGTFGKVNGMEYVIDLAEKSLILDNELVYILVGSGAEKENTIALSKEKGVWQKNVFVFDAISKRELPQWYANVDMGSSFVIPIKELWANSANKFFDTLAAGKPILINHQGWQKEVIEKDNLGYVLPEQLTDENVQDFVSYTQDKMLQETQKKNAFNKAKAFYSLDVAVEKYLTIFKAVVK